MITLTREEAQKILDALEYAYGNEMFVNIRDTLRAKLSEPEPEPVAWLNKTKHGTWSADALKCEGDEPSEPLYTAPPQREWVGLTDEELLDLADMAYANDLELLQTLQAKLKEKNG
jgi:hypothetical protein